MKEVPCCHGLSDEIRSKLEKLLPENSGKVGRKAIDNRLFIGIWKSLLEQVTHASNFEWLIIDASHIKVHPHAAGAKVGNQGMRHTKESSIQNYVWSWMRMV